MPRAFSTARITFCLAAASLVHLAPAPARADWPNARHDPKRTATASPSPSGITRPAPFWRYYLGGSLTRRGYLASDVNGDGKVEVIYVAGGKVIAKLPDDTLVWETEPVEIAELVGVDDVDGDGTLDVVAWAGAKAFVFSGKTGAIEWEEPDGEMGTVGGVRLGDLDGDGHTDVFVDECGCCGVNSGSPGVAWTFGKGFPNARRLWTSPPHSRCGTNGDTLGDFDGDGLLDVGYSNTGTTQMVRGKDGVLLGESAVQNTRGDLANCSAVNVDGRAGDEMICFLDSYQAGINAGGHKVWAVTFDAQAQPPVRLLWSHATTDVAKGQLTHVGASVIDLDGDGKKEVVVSMQDGGTFSLLVYDAADGTTLAGVAGSTLSTIVDLDGDGTAEVLATVGSDLHAYHFKRGGSPALDAFWTLPGGQGGAGGITGLEQVDWSAARRGSNAARALALDLDGDGVLEPVVLDVPVPGHPGALLGLKAATRGVAPTTLASFAIPGDVTLLAYSISPKVNRGYDQLLLTRNDGFLAILDNAFVPTNSVIEGEFQVPGMRVGGFYSGAYGLGKVPIAPRFDGANADSVVAEDSRRSLVRLEASGASLITPPTVPWQIPNAGYPAAVPRLDAGATGLALYHAGHLEALHADGSTIWSTPLAFPALHDALPGDANGDGVPDLFSTTDDATATTRAQVYDGKTGTPLWNAPVTEALQWGFEPFSVGDWDGDGKADLYMVLNTLRVHAGPTGALLASNPNFFAYFTPTLADVNFDGTEEVTLSAGYFPARTLAHDLNTALWTGSDDRPYAMGARATCGGAAPYSVWVQSSLANPGLVRLVRMSGASVGQTVSVVLAAGQLYADAAAARAAGKRVGTVGNATIKPNLAAADRPSAVLGSTDGWLYALDPCAARLDWSYNLRFPVGEAIFADTSGDGVDEVLVTAADGYLYDFAQQVVAAPDYVWDVDPRTGRTMADVDQIDTHDTLSATWSAVAGADSYEAAIITAGGSYVSQPNWQNLGNDTTGSISRLPLVDGKRYFFAVRAVSTGKGASTESISNGVTVHVIDLPSPDLGGAETDAGADGDGGTRTTARSAVGCSCRVTSPMESGADGTNGASGCALLASVALSLLHLRQRARRRVGR